MKNFSAFLFGLIIILFSSCSDDDSNPSGPAISVPTLEIVFSDSTVSSGDTIEAGADFSIAFSGRKGPVNLDFWTLSLNNVDLPNYTNVPVTNPSAFTEVIMDLEAPLLAGTYSYTLRLSDANNISVSKSLTIIVIEDATIDETAIELIATDSTVFSDTTLALGTSFDIQLSALKGTFPMATWSILSDGIALSGFNENPVPDDSAFSINIDNIPVPAIEGTYTYTFQITDSNGDISFISWEITAADIRTFIEVENIQLGAQANSSFGSFFLIRTITVSLLSEANASNGEAIEFFYYNGMNGPTLFSPSDPDAGSLFGGSVANWLIRFNTQLQKTTLSYSNATAEQVDESLIIGTKADSLAVGDVILVETQLGQKAILVIRSLVPGNNGNIIFDIKIVN